MGRAARAGVRVGLFACLCLCRERPPCEGFIPSVAAEGPGGVPECAVCSPWRHGQHADGDATLDTFGRFPEL